MPRVLVTGGAGFIGSNLVQALLARGQDVRVLDNFSSGKRRNLAHLSNNLAILEGDLRNREAVSEAVNGVETIFHLAAQVSVVESMLDPKTCFEVNVQGTLNLLETARDAGARKVVIASSAAVYGENQALPLNESEPPDPLSPYAASKLTDEIYARLFTRAMGLPVVALRFFNVYGPRQSPDSDYAAAIPIFINRLLGGKQPTVYGDGHQVRDFIFVDDVVQANLLAAESDRADGQVMNVCTGQETSVLDLLQALGKILAQDMEPVFAPPRAGEIYRSLGDPRRAADTMQFEAQTSLVEGLRRTVEWFKQ